jgi:conjugative transfer region protein (TIGR03750 family)
MTDRHDILADRLNAEPVIFKGCSSSELGVLVGAAALVWLPFSLMLAGLRVRSPWVLGSRASVSSPRSSSRPAYSNA